MSTELPYPICKHIFPSGKRCHSPALRGKPLCYYHTRNRTLVDSNRYRQRSVGIPPLDDRAAIQMAINEVVAAIVADKISDRKAGKLLYAIQLASQNQTRAKEQQLAATDPVEMYEETFDQPLVTDVPDEERGESDLAEYANCKFSSLDNSQTHEYDKEPPKPPETETSPQRTSAFASRSEANHFYEKERQWIEEHVDSRPAPAADQSPSLPSKAPD